MKRMISFFGVLTLAVTLWGGNQATLQTEDKDSKNPTTDAAPQVYFGKGSKHKVFISAEDTSLYDELLSRNAITHEVDYGSFKMVIIEEQAIGGKSALMNFQDQVRDDQDLIAINGYILDTTDGQLTLNKVPADLRQTDMADAIADESISPRGGLYIIQFIGPVKDEWLEQLNGIGTEIVTYIPNNAYVVRADNIQAAMLSNFRNEEFVQFVGDYEPAFRLSPELQAIREGSNASDELIDITVQVIDSANAEAEIEQLKAIGVEFVSEHQVLNYRNVALKVSASRLGEMALIDNVFAVEDRGEPRLLDEAQGQILAGQLSTFDNDEFPNPVGPFYLNFLASKGFTSSQFDSFAVNIVDDAYTITGPSGHPDLPASRVVFQNNPTNRTGNQGGHGFLSAHILGGFNNGTGHAFEDADGHNYGLGIAPWARVGLTALFGPNASQTNPTAWENTAYGQGARISNNSWGYGNIIGGPKPMYNSVSQEYDRIVRDAQSGVSGNQQMIVVFSAGNDGAAGVTHHGAAKNVITVGASENIRPQSDSCGVGPSRADNSHDIADFSSRGPVSPSFNDGRFKPDIVAPGTHVIAGIPQANYNASTVCGPYTPPGQTLYSWSSGTSQAAPAVSGGATLLYQDFINKNLTRPSPAMAKAYLMNSATYLTGSGASGNLPSNSQGMGRIDLSRAFDGKNRILVDQTHVFGASGDFHNVTGIISDTSKPFRVTLAWTDAPGPTTGAPYVNNLDLEVTINGTTYKGNVFSGANSTSGGSFDTRNNVESVFLPAGTSGSFKITVRATNIAGDGVPSGSATTDQDFALVVYNAEATNSTYNATPNSLNFSATAGGANPANQSLNITNSNGVEYFTLTDNATWLSTTPQSVTTPLTATVKVNISGLAVGTYNGTITISKIGATTKHVPVTLTVNPPPPTISINPANLSFTAQQLGANPANRSLNITNSGGSTLNWTASDDASWLNLSSASGTAPSTTNVSVNISDLAVGTYNGTITISAPGATNSPVSMPVTLTVTEPPPEISINPSGLNFTAQQLGGNPASRQLSITNSGGGTLNWTASENASWLSITSQSGTAPSTVAVMANISGLAPGTHHSLITISAPGTTVKKVPVKLTVTEPPAMSVSPASLSFSVIHGDANPVSKSLNITNSGGGTLIWSASDDASWLNINPASGNVSSAETDTVSVSVNISGLDAGTYNGTITILSPSADAIRYVHVILTIDRPPAISVDPTGLRFTATAGESNPASKSFNITNSGGDLLKWTVSDNASWLSVSPTSGTAPSIATISVNISGLAVGTYNGTITISAPGAITKHVPVELTVNPPVQ